MAVLLAALLAAPAALARSGSGSSHFGGGGGGFGRSGGGGFGGRGHFLFIPIGGGGGFLILVIIAILVFWILPKVMTWWRGQQTAGRSVRQRVAGRQEVKERERRVELAAAEASEDDSTFAPDVVRPAATQLFQDVQSAWDRADRATLAKLVAPDLYQEWARRLDDFDRKGWRNRVQVASAPSVDYVGLRNAADDREDRVTVLIQARLRDHVVDAYGQRLGRTDTLSDTTMVREYWTLGKRDGNWILLSIEQGAEGEHALSDEIVATPWSDDRAMRDEALIEGAVADAVPEHTNIAELADLDFTGDARAAANDLSLADGRFAPDILEVAARRAIQAWAEAVDGDDAKLNAIAHPAAAQELLHPGDPEPADPGRRPGPARPADPDRRAGRRRDTTDDDDRNRPQRAAIPRGSRYGGRRQRQPITGDEVHRALDARPRRRREAAVADRERRLTAGPLLSAWWSFA